MSAGDKLLYMYCRQEGRDKDHGKDRRPSREGRDKDPQGSLRVCQMTLLMTLRDDQSVSDDPVGCSLHV